MQDKIVINDYIENDPLSEENLDKTLVTVYEIRLSSPSKSIWIYTGYTWNEIFKNDSSIQAYYMYDYMGNDFINNEKRKQIISQCSVMVDGRYVDSQRDITLKWRGSLNQNIWKNCNGIWKNITNEI